MSEFIIVLFVVTGVLMVSLVVAWAVVALAVVIFGEDIDGAENEHDADK